MFCVGTWLPVVLCWYLVLCWYYRFPVWYGVTTEEVGHENIIILHRLCQLMLSGLTGVAWVYIKPDDVIIFVTNLLCMGSPVGARLPVWYVVTGCFVPLLPRARMRSRGNVIGSVLKKFRKKNKPLLNTN